MNRYKPVSDEEVDIQVRSFLESMGMTVGDGVMWRQNDLKYDAKYNGFDLRIRVASKPMLIGQRIIYMEFIYGCEVFLIIGLDTQNKVGPSPEHMENLDVGLASVVYQKT